MKFDKMKNNRGEGWGSKEGQEEKTAKLEKITRKYESGERSDPRRKKNTSRSEQREEKRGEQQVEKKEEGWGGEKLELKERKEGGKMAVSSSCR